MKNSPGTPDQGDVAHDHGLNPGLAFLSLAGGEGLPHRAEDGDRLLMVRGGLTLRAVGGDRRVLGTFVEAAELEGDLGTLPLDRRHGASSARSRASLTAALIRKTASAVATSRLWVEPEAPSKKRKVPPRSFSSSCAARP